MGAGEPGEQGVPRERGEPGEPREKGDPEEQEKCCFSEKYPPHPLGILGFQILEEAANILENQDF